MSSNEFTRICRELFALNETVTIETKKGYIKFTVSGENANGSIKIEENTTSDENEATTVQVEEDVKLDFALRYFYFYFLDILICLLKQVLYLSLFVFICLLNSLLWLNIN